MATSALNTDLMGLGLPAQLADVLGDTAPGAVAGAGTAQSGATPLTGTVNQVTTAAGNTAFLLPAAQRLLSSVHVYNASATAALVFPPSGGNINQLAADASFSVAQGRLATFIRVSATKWIVQYGA